MILKKRIAVIIKAISLYIKKLGNNLINHEYNMNIVTSYKRSNMSPIKILGEEI